MPANLDEITSINVTRTTHTDDHYDCSLIKGNTLLLQLNNCSRDTAIALIWECVDAPTGGSFQFSTPQYEIDNYKKWLSATREDQDVERFKKMIDDAFTFADSQEVDAQ